MKTYHVRVDPDFAGRPGGTLLEVALEETPGGVRVAVAGRRDRRVDLAELVPGWYSFVIDGRSHTLAVATWRTGPAGIPPRASGDAAGGGTRRWTLLLDGVAVAVEVGSRFAGRRGGAPSAAGTAGQVRAPMPGLVVAIQAEPGMAVVPGQPLIIMEAMKMQMEIRATRAGVVREVRVVPGQDVAGNDLLVTVE